MVQTFADDGDEAVWCGGNTRLYDLATDPIFTDVKVLQRMSRTESLGRPGRSWQRVFHLETPLLWSWLRTDAYSPRLSPLEKEAQIEMSSRPHRPQRRLGKLGWQAGVPGDGNVASFAISTVVVPRKSTVAVDIAPPIRAS